ncbi:MAG: YqeG family HAD IIIA-type phosphatase [Eubacteriales bacterium]|nr:YqeG family HAD IIIA-type phosphatase [Eubacteriales bacterium]
MGIFDPEYIFTSTTAVTPGFLLEHGMTHVLLDVDNTLTTHDNPVPAEGIPEWVASMKKAGIRMIIISNNNEKRVAPFADRLGLRYTYLSMKPLSKGFKEGMRILGGTKEDTVVLGDQIYTDVFGAHLFGVRAIMVLPIQEEEGLSFRIRRKLEKKHLKRYADSNGGFMEGE